MAHAGDVITDALDTDAALVDAARAGSPDAFAALYEGHRARVAGVVRRRVPPADVDDVVQDTFARAWQRLGTLEDGDRFGPWVRTIAVRTAADHLRSSGARDLPVGGPLVVDATDEVVERLDRRQRADDVVAQLGALSPRDGRALWLRDALNTSVPDLADELGMTEASTRVLLSRARRRLRGIVGAVAAWLGGLLIVRRPTMGASPVPVAAVLGAAVAVGVSSMTGAGPAPPRTPAPTPTPVTSAVVDTDSPPAPRPADTPGTVAATPASRGAGDVGTVVADAPSTPPTAPDDPLPDPRLERRPVAAEDPNRDLTLRGPDGEAVVGVHDGGELDVVPLVEVAPGRVAVPGTDGVDLPRR